MTMMTRAERQAQFAHVFSEVLELGEDDVLYKVFKSNQINTMEDLFSIPDDKFNTLQYFNTSTNKYVTPLEPLLLRLRILKAWFYYLLSSRSITTVDWKDLEIVNINAYDDYRVSHYNSRVPTNPSLGADPPSTDDPLSTDPFRSKSRSSVAEFKKGVKRDKSAYLNLKDERNWDNWKRRTVATVHAHGCQNVLNPKYKPPTPDDAALLREQNNFMYDVFATILLTHMGSHFIAVHESSRDAQKVWSDYTSYMKTSTRADTQIEHLMRDLTSLRLSKEFKGSTQTFLTEWLNKMMQYEKLTPTSAHFPATVQKAMLQNAVQDFPAFGQAKTQEQIEVSRGNGPIPYRQFISLLFSISASYDKRSTLPTSQRLINFHQQGEDLFYEYAQDNSSSEFSTDDEHYEVDDHFGSYLVHASDQGQRRRFRPSLPRAVWNDLSKDAQQSWDQVPYDGKWAIIRGIRASALGKPSSTARTAPTNVNAATRESNISDDLPINQLPPSADTDDVEVEQPCVEEQSSLLVQAATRSDNAPFPSQQLHPADVRRLMSTDHKHPPKSLRPQRPTKYKSNSHIRYVASGQTKTHSRGVLVDRGANGGMAGKELRIITRTDRRVDVSGIDNHEMTDLHIVSAGGVVSTQRGLAIAIFHQYAHVPNGKTILSCVQSEAFGIHIDDRSSVLGRGQQTITTLEGFILPLNFINGLPYLPSRPFTDSEWNTLPHILMTSDTDWDPARCDDTSAHDPIRLHNIPYDGGSHDFVHPSLLDIFQEPIHTSANIAIHSVQSICQELYSPRSVRASESQPSPTDYSSLRDYFLRASISSISKTFDATTQYARAGWISGHITDTYRSPFPALNVKRRHEPVATDTIYSDTPAIDDGSTCAQFFVGIQSRFCDAYGMSSDASFIHTLHDVIRKRGAMATLVTDGGKALISKKVEDTLRHLCIDSWHSEAHYQHQNYAERRYGDVKRNVNRVMNMVGAPAHCWLLCLCYVIFIMNRMALESLRWRTPYEKLTGNTPDISMIYRFKFYDKIYFKRDESRGGKSFPSESNELLGRFVGFSEDVGHGMTFKILTDDTLRILHRSRIKLASIEPNLRVDAGQESSPLDNQARTTTHIRGGGDNRNPNSGEDRPMATITFDDLIGRSYLTDPNEDGTRRRLKIIEQLKELDSDIASDPLMVKFRAQNDDETVEEVITYNQIIDKLESNDSDTEEWKFRAITGHRGPINPNDSTYKGSSWNVQIEWENGETTWEPLSIIGRSDPVTCAIYAKDNNLLSLDGWKRFRKLARRQKKLLRLVNQAKLQSFRTRPVYKFGVQVPRNHQHAMELDEENGNTLWKEAEDREIGQIDEYEAFVDIGRGKYPGKGYKRIVVHLVYDVKPSLKRKARLVANGNLTDTPIDSIYSSVVSLRGLKLTIFIAELNQLETWCTDVGNAYLEAYTAERVYIIAGPEFGDRAGHTLIISKALYGLKSSGKRWWERFSDILSDMGFYPSRAEDDIWMRDMDDHYEYIARYVDDMAIVSRQPKSIINQFMTEYKLKLKGSGPISYHLGCDFHRDEYGTLCMSPKRYIERMIDNYVRMFGAKPKCLYTSPLEKNDHPELDTSPELDEEGIKQYQSLIGTLQWVITLGRLDVATAVMSMSSFRAAPREGHLQRLHRIYGYLSKMKHAAIRFRPGLPDHSDQPANEYEWEKTVYKDAKEILPGDAPEPRGPPIVTTSYVDANLCHDMTTGKSVTGIIHFVNKTIVDFYTKKQAVVETATYGSEYMAARTATEQIIDLRTTLRYLGLNLKGTSYLFGDNNSVVTSSSTPGARLHKRHLLLSFHRVREAIAAKIISFIFIPGAINPADVLSKHWGYQAVWTQLQSLLFWQGNTLNISK